MMNSGLTSKWSVLTALYGMVSLYTLDFLSCTSGAFQALRTTAFSCSEIKESVRKTCRLCGSSKSSAKAWDQMFPLLYLSTHVFEAVSDQVWIPFQFAAFQWVWNYYSHHCFPKEMCLNILSWNVGVTFESDITSVVYVLCSGGFLPFVLLKIQLYYVN